MTQTIRFLGLASALLFAGVASAQAPFGEVAHEVNRKLVKVYGSGGFRGLPEYGTGILISPKGHVLTAANHLLDTSDLLVHLYDGRRFAAKLIVIEPELDCAIIKIDAGNPQAETDLDLPYFDAVAAAKAPLAQPGDWVLGFSNQFKIAVRDEPLSVQRGVVAGYTKLHGRRGIFDYTFVGEVYIIDAITNNPGAAGGALTTRKGELIGILGKELRNALTETWINYAIPLQTKIEVKEGDKARTVSMAEFLEKGPKGEWNPTKVERAKEGPGGYDGIILVPNVVERTPPFVDGVRPDSPAAKAGLQPDDLIVYVDGEPVTSIKAYKEYMAKTQPGMPLKLEIRRGDKLIAVDLKLEEIPKRK
ncbi:MAG: S1C family serine protease [Gemmataceae bacterium]